jgi:hypothetical protein
LLNLLGKHKGFIPLPYQYMLSEFQYFATVEVSREIPHMRLFLAHDNHNTLVAGALIMFYKDTANYLFGRPGKRPSRTSRTVRWLPVRPSFPAP